MIDKFVTEIMNDKFYSLLNGDYGAQAAAKAESALHTLCSMPTEKVMWLFAHVDWFEDDIPGLKSAIKDQAEEFSESERESAAEWAAEKRAEGWF